MGCTNIKPLQAIIIVNHQETPSGPTASKKSRYVNAAKLDSTFFDDDKEENRKNMLKENMGFLWQLIEAKLESSHHNNLAENSEMDNCNNNNSDSDLERNFEENMDEPDKDTTEHVEGKMYVKSKDKKVNLKNCLNSVSVISRFGQTASHLDKTNVVCF